jgi:hypothetical protein
MLSELIAINIIISSGVPIKDVQLVKIICI